MSFIEETTIFHLTHYKAGSRWVHRILKRCSKERLIAVQGDRRELMEEPIQAGRIYSACYASKDEFDNLDLPPDTAHFFILRDLRDTLVSAYFSLKISHPTYKVEAVNEARNRLQDMELDEGLHFVLADWVPLNAHIQRSWIDSGEPYIRFEDMLENGSEILEEVLLDKCNLGVPRARLQRAIEMESFERLSGGRSRGQEDTAAHYRKGIAGDWRNYFSDSLKDAFKKDYGDILVKAGYEQDDNW